ncbi:hypothetical protein QOT17_025067 [Balamuthia mandrillaris]
MKKTHLAFHRLEEPKKQATNEAEENTTALPLRAFIKDSNKWQEKKGLVAPHPDEELDRKQLRRLLSDPSRCLLLLNDFDNHLDDVHLAWLTQNPLLLLNRSTITTYLLPDRKTWTGNVLAAAARFAATAVAVRRGGVGSDRYFNPEATNAGSNCPQTDPCADPFPLLAENVFEEYRLATGEYTFSTSVLLSQSLVLRKWTGAGDVILKGQTGTQPCFTLPPSSGLPMNLMFRNIIVECGGMAFDFSSNHTLDVEMTNVTVRNSGGGVKITGNETVAHRFVSTNLELSNLDCVDNGESALYLSDMEWTFNNLRIVSIVSCSHGGFLQKVQAKGLGGELLFEDIQTTTLYLDEAVIITDLTFTEFLNNEGDTMMDMSGFSTWGSTGPISFHGNTADYLISTGESGSFLSLLPLDLQNNILSQTTFNGASDYDVICAVPCEGPAYDPKQHLYLNLINSSVQHDDNLKLPLVVEVSSGNLRYEQHFRIEPAPSNITGDSRAEVELPMDGVTEVELRIERLVQLPTEATISITADIDPTFLSFFLSFSSVQVVLDPRLLAFQPDESTLSVTFPNGNKPDHPLSIYDPQQDKLNSSVAAQFATLMEVDEEGNVVAMTSLQATDFVMEELGNTSFNLNNALPFISFFTDITSLQEGDALVNVTQPIRMQMNFTMFAKEQLISFAGVEQVMAANTLKWNIFLSAWPFQHESHSLQLHLFITSLDGAVVLQDQEVKQGKNGVQQLMLETENTRIPFNVLPLAVVDGGGEDVVAKWVEEEQKVVIWLPWFQHSLLLDPDMSLLVENEEEEDDEDDGLWWKIVVPLVSVLLLVVVVAVVIFVLWRGKKQKIHNISRRGSVNY